MNKNIKATLILMGLLLAVALVPIGILLIPKTAALIFLLVMLATLVILIWFMIREIID